MLRMYVYYKWTFKELFDFLFLVLGFLRGFFSLRIVPSLVFFLWFASHSPVDNRMRSFNHYGRHRHICVAIENNGNHWEIEKRRREGGGERVSEYKSQTSHNRSEMRCGWRRWLTYHRAHWNFNKRFYQYHTNKELSSGYCIRFNHKNSMPTPVRKLWLFFSVLFIVTSPKRNKIPMHISYLSYLYIESCVFGVYLAFSHIFSRFFLIDRIL